MLHTALVAELFQAANKIDKIPLAARRQLLEKAVITISTLRQRAEGIDGRLVDTSDLMLEIKALIEVIPAIDAHRLSKTFLACAEVIRSLHILTASRGA